MNLDSKNSHITVINKLNEDWMTHILNTWFKSSDFHPMILIY